MKIQKDVRAPPPARKLRDEGVLYEVCEDENQYFDYLDGSYTNCPSFFRLTIVPASLAVGALLNFIFKCTAHRSADIKHELSKILRIITKISIQAKLKMIISFFQVTVTLQPIYGLRVHSEFKVWFNFLQIFDLGIAELVRIPGKCFGYMKSRLLISAIWPYTLVLLAVVGILLRTKIINAQKIDRKDATVFFWSRFLHVTIVVFYLVLPSISRNI